MVYYKKFQGLSVSSMPLKQHIHRHLYKSDKNQDLCIFILRTGVNAHLDVSQIISIINSRNDLRNGCLNMHGECLALGEKLALNQTYPGMLQLRFLDVVHVRNNHSLTRIRTGTRSLVYSHG